MKEKTRFTMKRDIYLRGITVSLFLLFQMSVIAQDKASPLVGTWEKFTSGVTMTFTLDSGMNYQVDFESDGNIEVQGSYTIEDNTVTFNDKPGGYATEEPGIYTFKIEKDKVTFIIKDDPSPGRSGLLAGTWMKGKD